MSSIMRARSGLMGRGEVSEVIGLSRAEGCWTFDARDRMPRPSRLTAYSAQNARTATRALPRERVRSAALPGHSAFTREWLFLRHSRPPEMVPVSIGIRVRMHPLANLRDDVDLLSGHFY